MNCKTFVSWLENKDMHDVSEADLACRHAAECERCGALLKKDELLDQSICKAFEAQPLPAGLKNRIDLSLQSSRSRNPAKGLIALASAICLVMAVFFNLPDQPGFDSMEALAGVVIEDHFHHNNDFSRFDQAADPSAWLASHLDKPAQKPDQLPEGYVFSSVRFCTLGHCQAVHMVYEKDGEWISVFIIDGDEVDFKVKQGEIYTLAQGESNLRLWKQDDRVYVSVS